MDIPDKCPVLWIGDGEVDITSDCQQKHLAFLVCGQGHYYPMTPKHASKFDACHFDADALDYSVDHCIAIMDNVNQSCEPVHVNNMGDLENIHAYLESRTQNTANDIRPYAAYFRIDRFDPRLLVNRHYSVLLHGGDTRSRRMYIDVQGKRVLYDRGNVPHSNLCLIERRGNQTTTTTTMATETKANGTTIPPGDEFPSEIGDAIMEKVMTKDDLGISSSFGLQNCYCDRCRPENTVGKIYNGSCVLCQHGQWTPVQGNRRKQGQASPLALHTGNYRRSRHRYRI